MYRLMGGICVRDFLFAAFRDVHVAAAHDGWRTRDGIITGRVMLGLDSKLLACEILTQGTKRITKGKRLTH